MWEHNFYVNHIQILGLVITKYKKAYGPSSSIDTIYRKTP